MPVPALLKAAAAIALVLLPARFAAAQPASDPLTTLRALDARIATIGFRLATRNTAWCPDRQWQPGFAIQHLSQYSRSGRADAAARFKLGTAPGVLALAAGGPAEAAGLHLDDSIIAADGHPLPRAPADAHDTFAPTETMLAALEASFADGVATLDISREGTPLEITIRAVRGCASRFQLIPSSELNSRADGRYVQVSSAMAELARNDDELAATVAHELAHNILHHRARLNAAGVDRGLFASFGRSARLFRETELQADRFSIYLLDQAGYDVHAAMDFLRRLARRSPNWFGIGTHPDWGARLAAMNDEIERIAAARRRGDPIRPPDFSGPLGTAR